ncbi:MAG: hypothetical protein IKW67_00055 [Alphaproteobacteria bacterium]|nr:hypothetical protein [Alphaproteobacteria bacterium]
MKKILYIFSIYLLFCGTTNAITRDARLTDTTPYNYNYMYPYMNNNMRTNLNPGVTNSQSTNPINTVVKTTKIGGERRVVPRPTSNVARAATSAPTAIRGTTPTQKIQTSARAAIPVPNTNPQRRVVARSAAMPRGQTMRSTTTTDTRGQNSYAYRGTTTPITTGTTERVSSVRCLADYTECMNRYCEREDTAYNRCYCSSKLSQIDAMYQSKIESLIKQLLTTKDNNRWSDAEMNKYWMETVGKYSDGNSWENIDASLDINWADLESRVRGQNAFATGHEYCVQHLRGCNYMATNLRDVYRSEIARDCAAYEQSLLRIKNAAESILGLYND